MARKTNTTTTTKDSGAKHNGEFSGAVASIRKPGDIDSQAGTTPQAHKNAQNEIYSSFHMDRNTREHTPLPVTGLDTDTN